MGYVVLGGKEDAASDEWTKRGKKNTSDLSFIILATFPLFF